MHKGWDRDLTLPGERLSQFETNSFKLKLDIPILCHVFGDVKTI
jgi:hypothetical protein